jgi:hypothetical protein
LFDLGALEELGETLLFVSFDGDDGVTGIEEQAELLAFWRRALHPQWAFVRGLRRGARGSGLASFDKAYLHLQTNSLRKGNKER